MMLPKTFSIPLNLGLFKTLFTGSGKAPPFSILSLRFSHLNSRLFFSLIKLVNLCSKLFLDCLTRSFSVSSLAIFSFIWLISWFKNFNTLFKLPILFWISSCSSFKFSIFWCNLVSSTLLFCLSLIIFFDYLIFLIKLLIQ